MAKPVSAMSVGIKYGLMAALVSIAVSLIFKLLDLNTGTGGGIASTVITGVIWAAGIYMAHKEYKAGNKGTMSFGTGFKAGIIFSLVFAILSAAFGAVYIGVIDPQAMEAVDAQMEIEREAMEDRGMTDEEIETAMSIAGTFSSPVAIFFISFLT